MYVVRKNSKINANSSSKYVRFTFIDLLPQEGIQ